ncbi:mitochondrial RNA pseudouridine synthase Rpusd4 [Trichonephila clavipes]|nr:mitochondrial RNA pseudouridine synthase Rpusd4 [Trichonephila clavipes]
MLPGSLTSLTALFHGCGSHLKLLECVVDGTGEVVLEVRRLQKTDIALSAKRNRRTTAQQVANQFLAASGKQISRKTVARRLRGGGLYARRPVVCAPLTRQHRTARLQWCREHHNWTEQDWACVLFSDESRFSLSSDCRCQLIWRESGTAFRPGKGPISDMQYHGDCLDSEGIQRLVWPARSPDLNPIENVWDALWRQVAGRNYPSTNKNTLIRALTEEWDKLPQQLLGNVVQRKFIPKTEKLDSKGFRILKHQVPSLMYYTRDEIIDLLVKNVLYSDDDVIVLNKPYNLVIHDSKTVKEASLSRYLDDLASELDRQTNKPKLFTVHRLDKETTGCLLLARNETSAHMLKSLFAQRKIIKTYWIVTIKVPDPLEGVIDIPISEGSVKDKARMVLHPDLPKDISYKNHSAQGKRAVTHYKVIAQSGNAALVEVKPETGLKHQIRVHFGFGLSCPILGDHKYSYLDKLVPQKLQADLLQRLYVRQSKVRYIPMHIYARSVLIPQYKGGRNLFVMAPMPIHMSKNLQKLKFKKNY